MRTPERSWPLPVALIALSATTYASSGCCSSCQGSAAGTRPGTIVPAGCWPWPARLVALSAIWMTLFYEAQAGTGDLLYMLRLIFASAMAACLVLGLAAGTQVFTEGIGGTIFGTGVLAADPAKGAGWAINLAIAESAIRRPAPHRPALPTCPQQTGALA